MSQRRILGGARREASERVVLRDEDLGIDLEGWTLNVSHGGLRIVVEEVVGVAQTYDVSIGDTAARPARVVWVREEADGRIVGLEFLDVEAGVTPYSAPAPS